MPGSRKRNISFPDAISNSIVFFAGDVDTNMRLRHARIVTEDVPVLAQFYQTITGITPTGSDDYLEFRTPEGAFAISSQRKMVERGAGATVPAANRSMVLDFEVDDVDKERARLHGIVKEFVIEPTNQPWGNRSMLFRDPDGNLINFFTPQNRTVSKRELEQVNT